MKSCMPSRTFGRAMLRKKPAIGFNHGSVGPRFGVQIGKFLVVLNIMYYRYSTFMIAHILHFLCVSEGYGHVVVVV